MRIVHIGERRRLSRLRHVLAVMVILATTAMALSLTAIVPGRTPTLPLTWFLVLAPLGAGLGWVAKRRRQSLTWDEAFTTTFLAVAAATLLIHLVTPASPVGPAFTAEEQREILESAFVELDRSHPDREQRQAAAAQFTLSLTSSGQPPAQMSLFDSYASAITAGLASLIGIGAAHWRHLRRLRRLQRPPHLR